MCTRVHKAAEILDRHPSSFLQSRTAQQRTVASLQEQQPTWVLSTNIASTICASIICDLCDIDHWDLKAAIASSSICLYLLFLNFTSNLSARKNVLDRAHFFGRGLGAFTKVKSREEASTALWPF